MSWFLDYIIRAKDQAKPVVQAATKDLEQLERQTEGNQAAVQKWTAAQQRAAMAMSGVHEQALKMNAEMNKSWSDKLDAKVQGLTGGLVSLSGAVGAISWGAAVAGFKSVLTAQAETEAAANKLNVALANQGRYSEQTSRNLLEFASSLQRTTTLNDDAVVAAEAVAASFGMNEEQIKRVTAAAADLAAATGTDLENAVKALGKAYSGNTESLREQGIVIDESIPKSERFEAAMSALEQRFGGQAQAAAATYTGQLKQLSNAFGDVQESLGKLLGEMGDGAGTGWMRGSLEWLSDFFGKTLVIALGEARAQVVGLFADLSGQLAKFYQEVVDHPVMAKLLGVWTTADGAKKTAQYFTDMTNSLRAQMRQIRDESERAAASVGKVLAPTNRTGGGHGAGAGSGTSNKGKTPNLWVPNAVEWADARRQFDKDMLDYEDKLAKAAEAYTPLHQATAKWMGQLAEAPHYTRVVLKGVDKLGERAATVGSSMKAALGSLPQVIMGALQGGGSVTKSVGSLFGGALGDGLQAGATKALGFLGKTLSGALGSMLPGIGSALGGAIGGLFGKLFGGDKYAKETKQLRDEFIKTAGGMEQLKKRAAEAGVSLEKFLSNKRDVASMKAEIDRLQNAFRLHDEAQEKMNAAVQRYGLTIEELGPKWAKQELDKQAAQLLQDYELLKAGGADMVAVIGKMGPELSKYVDSAVRSGTEIPSAMKPVIDALWEQGKLLHEDGTAYTEAEYQGLKYGKTMTESFQTMLEAIYALVDALGGDVPEAFRRAGDAADEFSTHTPGGGNRKRTNPNTDTPSDNPDYAARGAVVLPFRRMAAGGIVAARPGGAPLIAGEGGQAELVAPVRALAREIGAAAAAAAGGGTTVIPVYIGGEKIDEVVLRRTRTGHMRVDAAGIRRRG